MITSFQIQFFPNNSDYDNDCFHCCKIIFNVNEKTAFICRAICISIVILKTLRSIESLLNVFFDLFLNDFNFCNLFDFNLIIFFYLNQIK